jgi:hypothetical protein
MFQRASLLIVTAVVEVATGLALLLVPAVPIKLLLGLQTAAPEVIFISRVTGAALLSIGVSSWLARNDRDSVSQRGVLIGVLIYDVIVAMLLAFAALVLKFVGVALWPGVVLHSALAVWAGASLASRKQG